MFAKGEFDKKIRGIFTAFDLDGSGGIDRKELLMFISTGILGLCKLVNLPIPRSDEI
jgi:Ca2+-binding EF-hand superfamily protein